MPAPDPDLEIRGGGGGEGKRRSAKILFLPLGPQFGLKIKRGGGRRSYPSPSPGSATIF